MPSTDIANFTNTLNSISIRAFTFFGAKTIIVPIIPVGGLVPVAAAAGIRLELLPNEITLIGGIMVNQNFINNLRPAEWEFVISHESAHIFNDHSITRLLVNMPNVAAQIVDLVEGNRNLRTLVDLLRATALLNRELPFDAHLLREQELQADAGAIDVTHDIQTAINFFTRFSGGNLDTSSHTFELFGNNFPALTWRERIAALSVNIP